MLHPRMPAPQLTTIAMCKYRDPKRLNLPHFPDRQTPEERHVARAACQPHIPPATYSAALGRGAAHTPDPTGMPRVVTLCAEAAAWRSAGEAELLGASGRRRALLRGRRFLLWHGGGRGALGRLLLGRLGLLERLVKRLGRVAARRAHLALQHGRTDASGSVHLDIT